MPFLVKFEIRVPQTIFTNIYLNYLKPLKNELLGSKSSLLEIPRVKILIIILMQTYLKLKLLFRTLLLYSPF